MEVYRLKAALLALARWDGADRRVLGDLAVVGAQCEVLANGILAIDGAFVRPGQYLVRLPGGRYLALNPDEVTALFDSERT